MSNTPSDSLVDNAKEFVKPDTLNETELYLLAGLSAGQSISEIPAALLQTEIRADLIRWLCLDSVCRSYIGRYGIHLSGIRIRGQLDLDSVHIPFPITFTDCIFQNDIILRFAETRSLIFNGGRIRSFLSEGLIVKGVLCLHGGIEVRGIINLVGARIDGNLDCSYSYFIGQEPRVIQANRVEVGGSVLFDQGFKAEGEVQIIDAVIKGNLSCSNGMFLNAGRDALSADRIQIGGSVFLNNGFTCNGMVRFPGGSINGQFNLDGCKFTGNGRNGFFGQNLNIREGFFWRGAAITPETELILAHANVGQLCDDASSWVSRGKLIIDGFVYNEIALHSPTDSDSRIDWLRRQPAQPFRPQPFEQLASVLKKNGFEEEARLILIEKQKYRLLYGNVNRRSYYWNKLLGIVIGYGYRPHRSLIFMIAFILLGMISFHIGYTHDAFAPSNIRIIADDQYIIYRNIPEAYPSFNALLYSLDTFLPIVDLHQSTYWLPNQNRGSLGVLLFWYVRFHIIIGWILTTLAVLGFSGIVRKD